MKPNFKKHRYLCRIPATERYGMAKSQRHYRDWKTPEHISVKPVYTKEDLEGMEHLNYTQVFLPISVAHTP